MRLVRVDAGNLRNAIPREAFAELSVPEERSAELNDHIAQMRAVFCAELARVEPHLRVELTTASGQTPDFWTGKGVQERLIHAVCACPTGVMRMSDTLPGLVETSSNLAVVRSGKGLIEVQNLVRSSVDSARDALCESIDSLFTLAGAETDFNGHYPGWIPNRESTILRTVEQVYREIFGHPPQTGAMHAGLECGIIGAAYPQLDMISFGPTIVDPHSPDERVLISSVGRFWDLLVGTLARIPHRSAA
jgi:dipeptidase D